MRLEFPRTASVKDYLRTVDFESTEVKVHWTDERGDWVRRTFTSRPDNLVVQWLTAPKGQSVNVRITVSAGGGGMRGGGAAWAEERAPAQGWQRVPEGECPAGEAADQATPRRTSTSSG